MEKSIPMASLIDRYFLEHPRSAGQGYFQHLCFAWRFGSTLFGAACAAFLHGLLPNLHTSTASRTVGRLHAKMEARQRAESRLQADASS